ncbi:MAG: hypothetical protein ACK55K_00380 [Bacteroidota bacterium]
MNYFFKVLKFSLSILLIFSFCSANSQILPILKPKTEPKKVKPKKVEVQEITDNSPPSSIKLPLQQYSEPPDYISGNMQIVFRESTTLRVQGGLLARGWKWVWYKVSCGGERIGEGSQITIRPDRSYYYYVRGEAPGGRNTMCKSAYVAVDNSSRAPNKIISRPGGIICNDGDNKIELSVDGGRLGLNATWVWYEDYCSGKKIGYGDKINVRPTKSTAYFVRAEGSTNYTECVRLNVEVTTFSTAPQRIIAPTSVCTNTAAELEVKGGDLANDAKWVWYQDYIAPANKIDVGAKIKVRPKSVSKYIVRAEGFCNVTKTAECVIEMKRESVTPYAIDSELVDKKTNEYNLKVKGGYLGDNAKWVWYEKKCGGKNIDEGVNISHKVIRKETIFVRAEGACNTTGCASIQLEPENKSSVNLINLGLVTSGGFVRNPNLSFMVSGKNFYGKAKFSIARIIHRNTSSLSYEVSNNYLLNYPFYSGNYYTFNGRQFNKRTSLTFGYVSKLNTFGYYIGGGYGSNQQIWGVDLNNINNGSVSSQTWAKYSDYSLSGIETEAGLILNYKKINFMWGFDFLFGISGGTQKFFIDTNIGIGLNFNNK